MIKIAQVSMWCLCICFCWWIGGTSTPKELYALALGMSAGAAFAYLSWV